jgi:hypothetical protein
MDPSEIPNRILRELAANGIYRFVNPRDLDERADHRPAGLHDSMILPEHVDHVLSPAFWAERQRAAASIPSALKLPDQDERTYWVMLAEVYNKGRRLIDLADSGKVHIEQKEYNGITRYLAVCSEGRAFVCEITKEAFEALTKPDIISKRREQSTRRETEKLKRTEERNKLLRLSREIGMNARVSYFDGQSVKGNLRIQASVSYSVSIAFSCDAQKGIQINLDDQRFANYPQVTKSIEKLEKRLRALGVPGSFLGVRMQKT